MQPAFSAAPPSLLHTLMHDPVHRLSVARQNVAYHQPAHPGFFLGGGMKPPPGPSIRAIPERGK